MSGYIKAKVLKARANAKKNVRKLLGKDKQKAEAQEEHVEKVGTAKSRAEYRKRKAKEAASYEKHDPLS